MADLENFSEGDVAVSKQNECIAPVDQPKAGLMRRLLSENFFKVTLKSVHFKRDFHNFFIIVFIFCLFKEPARDLISCRGYNSLYVVSL